MASFMDLPYEVQCKIFLLIVPEDFSTVCSVSKHWNCAMNDSITWIGRLKEVNIHSAPDVLHFILFDRKEMISYYQLQCKSNLLRNINMDVGKADLTEEENFNPNPKYWDYHRGDWKIERHRGCDPFPAEARFARYNCVTSYSSCLRHQKIDLSKWYPNIANLITNGFKVRVYWTVWIAARYDCHSKYRAFILYGAGGRKSDENNCENIPLGNENIPAGRKWLKLSKTIDLNPSKGTVFWYYESAQDGKFWAGHYGAKILNPTIAVRIIPISDN